MSNKTIRDPRLSLPWFLLTTPTKAQLLVTTFDASKNKTGLGLAHGVQSYRDAQGRVGQVSRVYFEANSKRLRGGELSARLPIMSDESIQKRFFPDSKPAGEAFVNRPSVGTMMMQRFVPQKGKPVKAPQGPRKAKKLGPNVEIRLLRKARSESAS